MINGAHLLLFSRDAERDRTFFRDVLGFESVDAGGGWLIFGLPPAELATQITGKLTIPTVGIGAGPNCDAQVLVWQDMAGMTSGKTAKFVKRFGDVGGELSRAAAQYASEVASGAFPAEEHSF